MLIFLQTKPMNLKQFLKKIKLMLPSSVKHFLRNNPVVTHKQILILKVMKQLKTTKVEESVSSIEKHCR